jgi:hypothetical protein
MLESINQQWQCRIRFQLVLYKGDITMIYESIRIAQMEAKQREELLREPDIERRHLRAELLFGNQPRLTTATYIKSVSLLLLILALLSFVR